MPQSRKEQAFCLAQRLRSSVNRIVTRVAQDEFSTTPEDQLVLYAVQLTQRDIDTILDALDTVQQKNLKIIGKYTRALFIEAMGALKERVK